MKKYLPFLYYLKPYALILFIAIIATLLMNLSTLVQPYLLKYIVGDVLNKKDFTILTWVILVLIGATILKGITSYLQRFLMCLAGQGIIKDLRNKVFLHLESLPLNFFENWRTGDLMSRITTDVIILQQVIMNDAINLVNDSLVLVGALGWMLYKDWHLTIVTLLLAPLVGMTTNKFAKRISSVAQLLQKNLSDLTSIMEEIISGIRVVKAFCREDYEFERFKTANHKNLHFTVKSEKLNATQTPVIELFTTLGIAFVIWYGGVEVISGRLTSGEIFVFWGYMAMAITPLNRLTTTYSNVKRGIVSLDRLNELLVIKGEDDNKKPSIPPIKGKVQFKDICFSYRDDDYVLKNINISSREGEVIALVGPSGAGKTTFVNLIPRFYNPVKGNIFIDGYDIMDVNLPSLRKQIGIVPQDTVLFNGTIYDNILYGRLDASGKEVEEAAVMANAHDFIISFPDGYDTIVGDRGIKLSGGQRQRIAIARVILRNPRILILDEATSSLDSESEYMIQEAFSKLMKDRTTFIIAHRLSTVCNADKILVIEDGEIKETGNHEELMKNNGSYARLCFMQFQAAGIDR